MIIQSSPELCNDANSTPAETAVPPPSAGHEQAAQESHQATPAPTSGPPLDAKHRLELHGSGIDDAMIAAAGIYSADSAEIADVLGWTPKDRCWGRGLVIPFRVPDEATSYARVKLDDPRQDDNGKAIKYESPRKQPNRAYFPPGFWEIAADQARPLQITEGEKKALSAMQRGLACIGLVGVWGFAAKRPRRTTGKATGPRKLIPDLARIAWKGRTVAVIFDSDAVTNDEVQHAERSLASILRGRGANVTVVRLPQPDDTKVGLDDFLVAAGEQAPIQMHELLAKAAAESSGDTRSGDDKVPPPMVLADRLIARSFALPDGLTLRHWRDQFYFWKDGFYEAVPSNDMKKRILIWLDRVVDAATPRLAHEVAECVAARGLILARFDQPLWLGKGDGPAKPEDWISMANGILDVQALASGERFVIRPHTPQWFCVSLLPYAYDPTAQCPTWFSFLRDVFDGDEQRINLLARWFGLCISRETKHQAIMLLVGRRRSGKSTVLRVLESVVGAHNCAHPRLTTLGGTFGLWGLIDKSCAICPDAHLGAGDKAMAALEILKTISGEDAVEVHRKNLPSINVRLGTRFTLAVNELPRFPDSANALLPRLNVLPFFNSYEGREDRDLEQKLLAEVPGIFNWSVWGLQELRRTGRFIVPDASREVVKEFGRLTSPVQAFLEDCCVVAANAKVGRDALWNVWVGWCARTGQYAGSRATLGAKLHALVPRLAEGRPAAEGEGAERPRVYVGLALLDGMNETTPQLPTEGPGPFLNRSQPGSP